MSGSRAFVMMALCVMLGVWIGRLAGPPAIDFPDPGEARDAAAMEVAVGEALDEPRGFPRASALIRLFEGLNAENVAGAARALEQRVNHHDPVDLQLFLTAWAHVDPVGAMQSVMGWTPRSRSDSAIRIVMREWAASGAAIEAGGFFQSIDDPEVRRVAAGPLVRGWALGGDPAGARRLAQEFWNQEPRLDLSEALVRGIVHVDGAPAVLEMAAAIDLEDPASDGFDRRFVHVVLSLTARDVPEQAGGLYAELEARGLAGSLPGSLTRIADPWMKQSPSETVVWLVERTESIERDAALAEAMRGWALLELDEARAWMETRRDADLSSSATQVALVPFVRRLAQLDPAAASSWIPSIEDPERQAVLVNRVAYFWAPSDREAAEAWVDSLGLSPRHRRQAQAAMDRMGGIGEDQP